MKTLHELAEVACKELPEHWEIVITLENGDGVVSTYDPLGERKDDASDITEALDTQVIQAVGYAKAHADDYA